MTVRLGCIADDFTGATDLANALVRAGMRVMQSIGTPHGDGACWAKEYPDVDAVVVALKSRTIPADEAVAQSLEALAWLRATGAEQIYFKYCSTFDSTPTGNIGCVSEALLEALGGGITVAAPAFPENGRTVFQGHLFVGDHLLSESGMRDHPLTPMTDPDLVRVLQAQSRGRVALVPHSVVARGPEPIRHRLTELHSAGASLVVVDAVDDHALDDLARACAELALVTGASRLAQGLPANWGIEPSADASRLPPPSGRAAIIAGSVSSATRLQVDAARAHGVPVFRVDPLLLAEEREGVIGEALAFSSEHLPFGPVLVSSTASPEAVAEVQRRLGAAQAQTLVEDALAEIARGLVDRGVRQLVVAGGETSGAIVQTLGIRQLQIGEQIDPGIPWCATTLADGSVLHLALKSGNFGTPDFFGKALGQLRVPT